jgi:hypothetical protein
VRRRRGERVHERDRRGIGDPVLTFSPVPTSPGTIGLYSNGATSPAFTEVHVHDLRANPSTAHSFDFITSPFVNFAHHLGSFDDNLFTAPGSLAAGDVTPNLQFFTTPTTVDPDHPAPAGEVQDDEQRAFAGLEAVALGSAAVQTPERIEVLSASVAQSVTALLVRSPEPIRWERTELFVGAASPAPGPSPSAPGVLKIVGQTFSSGDPNLETVTVLVREQTNPSGFSLEWRPIPDPVNDPNPDWTTYFTFGTETALADGTQVHVLSGAPAAVDHDVGVALRFVAADASQAAVHFPAAGVELRLLSPAGIVVHQRAFVPDGTFAPIATSLVRKKDGTAFFLLLPVGATAPAAFRLSFTYVRAPTTTLPGLRQGGSELPERIALDVRLG